MSNQKRPDYVREELYAPFNNAPNVNRKMMITRMYQRILTERCVNRFKWSGLPDEIDVRFLELTLFNYGLSVFYFDGEYDRFMALRGSGFGNINMYDNPTRFRVYGNLMLERDLNARECVPIWANYMRIPDWDIIRVYSQRMAEFDTTIDINALTQRHPFLIAVGENERLTVQNAYRQVQEGQPVIFGTEAMNPNTLQEKISVFNMGIEKDAILNMQTAKNRVWNECLSFLGIENSNQEKKERMIVDEVNSTDGQVMASRAVAMNARREAVERINKMFGLAVQVDWRLDDDMTKGLTTDDDMTEDEI